MLLSIIIPVYNVADYLQTCIDSILANDCRGWEVILVDDGSTDGISPQICDENAARHPELIRVIHQQNKGPGGARNTGLEAARGEYLFFVDSDDTISPNALETLRRAVKTSHSEIYTFQMASHEGKGVYTPMDICPLVDGPFTLAERPEMLLSQPAIWARLWRRDLFLNMNIRFPDKAWYGEDLRTVTKLMALASSIEVLPDRLYFYLIRPGSIMRTENIERNRDILRAFEDIIQWFGDHGLLQQYRKELCYLAVDHLMLASTVRVARANPHSLLLKEFLVFTQIHFPEYPENKYVKEMSRMRKLAVRLVEKKCYRLIRLLFGLKDKL